MTITETRPEELTSEPGAVSAGPGVVAGWLTTADHTRIGRLFVGVSLLSSLGVLVIGTLLTAERVQPGSRYLPADTVDQLTSLMWIGLAFLVVVPLLLGIAIAVVPLQIGARSIAFPRAAALSFWGWLLSGGVLVASYIANGGPFGGNAEAVRLFAVSLIVLLAALVVGAATVAATVVISRAPGMDIMDAPPFSFAALVSSSALVLTLPALAGRLALIYVDQSYARIVFGGTKGISGQVGWAVLQPQTYVYGILIIGLMAELFPVAARTRQPMRGVVIGGIGIAGVAAVGGVMQGMQTLELSGVTPIIVIGRLVVYGITELLPVLPFLIVLGLGGLAMRTGRPRVSAPFVFAISGALMGLAGALTGVLTPISELALAGTVYQEAQATFLFFGALLTGMGAVTYWGPKLWGRMVPEKAAGGLAVLGLLATVLASTPYVLAGFLNQPYGAVTWGPLDGPIQACNVLVMIGFGLLTLTVLAFALLVLRAFMGGERAGADPWDGQTLEWALPSPPLGTLADPGWIMSPEPLLDRQAALGTSDSTAGGGA